jgi:hypothetical protein
MVGVFSPWIYGQGKGRKRVERELYFTQPPDYPYISPLGDFDQWPDGVEGIGHPREG